MGKTFIDGWHSKSSIRKVKTKTLSNIFQEKNNKCRQILIKNGFIFKIKMCINKYY